MVRWDISLTLNMTYYLSPIVGVADTSPTRRTRPFCRYRDISPVSAGESTPKEEAGFVFASMSREQTCLQEFANDDIHKALAFLIKNAENDSFNASALSAE